MKVAAVGSSFVRRTSASVAWRANRQASQNKSRMISAATTSGSQLASRSASPCAPRAPSTSVRKVSIA
jgi:hypothetical protein